MTLPRVHLETVELHPEITAVRDVMRDRFGRDTIDRRFTRDVFARHQHCLDSLPDGGTLLDVGVGQGILCNAAAATGRFTRIHGIDVSAYDHFVAGDWTYRPVDVEHLDYPDRAFDTVVAMEILEHLPTAKMHAAVGQLRRVARRVIVTVPWREKKLPSYHLQRFDEDRLAGLFPNGTMRLLVKEHRRKTHWLLTDETLDG